MAEHSRPDAARPVGRAGDKPRSKKERAALAELVEVERAIAALEGRSVDNAEQMMHLRGEAEQRRAQLEHIIATSRAEIDRRRRLLPYKLAAGVAAVGIAAAAAIAIAPSVQGRLAGRAKAIASATLAAKPFEGRFATAQTVVGEEALVVNATPGKCFVVVAASAAAAARVRVDREAGAREAERSVGWCSCKAEEVKVSITGPAPVATLVLEGSANAIGGADVLAALSPHPDATFAEVLDRPCAEASFDAWAAAQSPAQKPPEKLTGEEKALAAQGLTPVHLASGEVPFVLPRASGDVCMVALSRGVGDTLTLRRKGGDRPLPPSPGAVLGFCAKDASTVSVWREGSGEIALFAVPRARIGGLLGLRDAAGRAGEAITVWTAPDEVDTDARAALAASGISTPIDGLTTGRAAVFSISTDPRSMLAGSDVTKDVACRPALVLGATQAVCVEGRTSAFKPVGGLPAGVVSGPRPLWLALPAAPTQAQLERSLDVLAFARRMAADGFEVTSLVSAKLTGDGAIITGRSGEKEIVAIVVTATPPYMHTLAVADAPWKLTAPKPTALPASGVIKLRATPPYAGAGKREFVVWRR